MNAVVVGVEPRRPSVQALFWAADEASRRGVTIRLVAAVHGDRHLVSGDFTGHSALRVRAASALANAEDVVRELHPDLSPVIELIDGPPVAVLRERAADAALLVLGTRRPHVSGGEASGGGSVAPSLAARAECPVVLVRAPEHMQIHPRTLAVAVDDTPAGRAAVAFGVREALLRRARLRVVRVVRASASARRDDGLDAARRALAETARTWAWSHPDLDIVADVLNGRPVEQLLLVSQSALTLVVGQALGAPSAAAPLDPVVHGLLRHAECPVVTVPPPSHGSAGEEHRLRSSFAVRGRSAPA
ncbi:universal stress protein [Streptomyces sp. NPDC013181]|uniref:universal stress protein n=1 Tax=Streptomyces sp. NPDC013181 TaxID=3364864 RepID=UPI0036CB3803